MKKPISPSQHALIDYAFTGMQVMGPIAFEINDEAARTYQLLSTGFMATNALTDTPYGMKRLIRFEDHQKADAGFLAGLSILTFSKTIRKDKRTLCFHLGMLSMAALNYFLTDYKKDSKT